MGTIFGLLRPAGRNISERETTNSKTVSAWWHPPSQSSLIKNNLFLAAQWHYSLPEERQVQNESVYTINEAYIVADCRLDNRSELLSELHADNSISDTELLLVAYHKWGKDMLHQLIGDFSFAIWDASKERLFCARDQMGIRPFHYYFHDNVFAFGTQCKSILAFDGINHAADWGHLSAVTLHSQPADLSTSYTRIKKLAPAHYILVDKSGISIEQYWELDATKEVNYSNDEDYVSHFRELFSQAISDRYATNKEVGTHLSGGLDSSGITAFAHRYSKEQGKASHAFSYTVPKNFNVLNQKRIEENMLAHEAADYIGLDNFHAIYKPIDRDFPTRIKEVTQALDGIQQPLIVDTEYEIQAYAQQQGVNVLLSGFPGDELVTSFAKRYYLEYYSRGQYKNFFLKQQALKRGITRRLLDVLGGHGLRSMPDLTKKLVRKWQSIIYRRPKYYSKIDMFNPRFFNELGIDLSKSNYPLPASFHLSLRDYQKAHVSRANMHLRTDNEILAGLRHHVDYRYPLADIRLLQFVMSVPVEQKITRDTTRSLFRSAMKGYLPESIRLRDEKTAGVLNTTYLFNQRAKKEKGKLAYWNTLKRLPGLDFLDMVKIDKVMSAPHKQPFTLIHTLLIMQLIEEGKLNCGDD